MTGARRGLREISIILSELTGQTIPITMRNSLVIKLSIQPASEILNSMHEGEGFSAKTLWKKTISFAN